MRPIPACVLQSLAYHIDHESPPGRLNAVKLTFAKILGECPECGCDKAQMTPREGFVERFRTDLQIKPPPYHFATIVADTKGTLTSDGVPA
jgi:hypothetical protein